jgi:uncharacterized protein (TIGR02118 family)
VLYKNSPSVTFNWNYYLDTHIPLVRKLLGGALKDVLVQQGIAGGAPGSLPEYAVIVVLRFDSMDAFQKVFPPHGPTIMADVANFTNVEPTIQFSDVRLG